MPRMLFSFICVLVCLAGSGCTTRAPEIRSRGEVAVTMDADKKTLGIKMLLFHTLKLTLPPAPPNTYWQIAFHDPRRLRMERNLQPSSAPDTGPTMEVLAIARGRTALSFLLTPVSNERTVTPLERKDVTITVEDQ